MKYPKSFLQKLISFRPPAWVDLRILAIPVLIALFLLAMSWSEPLPQLGTASTAQKATATLVPSNAAGQGHSPTPIPEAWVKNGQMSNGIVLGGVILVMIVIGGTVDAIRRH
jgi:hypothetical protein